MAQPKAARPGPPTQPPHVATLRWAHGARTAQRSEEIKTQSNEGGYYHCSAHAMDIILSGQLEAKIHQHGGYWVYCFALPVDDKKKYFLKPDNEVPYVLGEDCAVSAAFVFDDRLEIEKIMGPQYLAKSPLSFKHESFLGFYVRAADDVSFQRLVLLLTITGRGGMRVAQGTTKFVEATEAMKRIGLSDPGVRYDSVKEFKEKANELRQIFGAKTDTGSRKKSGTCVIL